MSHKERVVRRAYQLARTDEFKHQAMIECQQVGTWEPSITVREHNAERYSRRTRRGMWAEFQRGFVDGLRLAVIPVLMVGLGLVMQVVAG